MFNIFLIVARKRYIILCCYILFFNPYNFSSPIAIQMSNSLENRWLVLTKNPAPNENNSLNNLTIKEIQFNSKNQQIMLPLKNIKPALPTKIYHHGYYKAQNKNKKILPGLSNKAVYQAKNIIQNKSSVSRDKNFAKPLRNTRNSEILNSIIQILKSDPDNRQSIQTRNGRIKTQPSYSNQFIQSRQISSVKNSRGPKIIGNQIMMFGNQKLHKRNLVSQQKSRPRTFADQALSISKRVCKKIDPFDQMQMTFYKPSKVLLPQQNSNTKKLQQNQFIIE